MTIRESREIREEKKTMKREREKLGRNCVQDEGKTTLFFDEKGYVWDP